MRYPHIPAQSVVYPFPGPQQPPASKVIVDRLIRRKVFGQQAPLATATQDVEDSIHHLAHVGGPRPSTSFCGRNERRQNSPLGIGQISRITCQDHSPRLYPKRQLHDLTTTFQTGSKQILQRLPCLARNFAKQQRCVVIDINCEVGYIGFIRFGRWITESSNKSFNQFFLLLRCHA